MTAIQAMRQKQYLTKEVGKNRLWALESDILYNEQKDTFFLTTTEMLKFQKSSK
jgi:hypothetical protein